MMRTFNRKLCLVLIWINALFASGHCEQFDTTTGAHKLSSSTTLTIVFSVLGAILGIAILVACCVCCYRVSKPHQEQRLIRRYYDSPTQICVVQPTNTNQQRTNINQQSTMSYGTAFPQETNSTNGWQQTTTPSNYQDNRRTIQGTR